MAKLNRLPARVNIEGFVEALVTALQHGDSLDYHVWHHMCKHLYKFIKRDPNVFKRFRECTMQLLPIRSQQHILFCKQRNVEGQENFRIYGSDYETILQLCSLILRYHGQFVNVNMLSTNDAVQKDIQRQELGNIYHNVDDISAGLDI